MSDIRCRVGWHDWNKYGEIVNAYDELTQFRNCKRCNKIDYAGCYGNQAKPEDVNGTIAKTNTVDTQPRDKRTERSGVPL